MSEWLRALVENYGYLAVAVGCLFEGEIALFLGALAVEQDILWFPGILGAAFVGTVIGDNLWFYLGRHLGQPFIARRPRWQARAVYARHLLERYGSSFIVCLRFFYGLRSVTPFVIGAAHVSRLRFFLCDLLGTAIWVTVIGTLVFFLGAAVDEALEAFQSRRGMAVTVAAGLAVLGALAGLLAWRLRLERRAREDAGTDVGD